MSQVLDAEGFDNPDHCVSGAILQCVAAGVPQNLIIPCRPWNVPDRFGKNAGKAPAIPDPAFPSDNDKWIGADNWESGNFATAQLLNADRKGANAGLLLGTPAEFPD